MSWRMRRDVLMRPSRSAACGKSKGKEIDATRMIHASLLSRNVRRPPPALPPSLPHLPQGALGEALRDLPDGALPMRRLHQGVPA
jgi:hypothetical protein